MQEKLSTHKDILLQLEKIEKKLTSHDDDIALIFEYLKQLLNPPQIPRREIGFTRNEEEFATASHRNPSNTQLFHIFKSPLKTPMAQTN